MHTHDDLNVFRNITYADVRNESDFDRVQIVYKGRFIVDALAGLTVACMPSILCLIRIG